MYYVYILRSRNYPEKIYTGWTKDLKDRLRRHNAGATPYTAKFSPWDIATYIALPTSEQARELERYLKSGSGRAFLKKRLLQAPPVRDAGA